MLALGDQRSHSSRPRLLPAGLAVRKHAEAVQRGGKIVVQDMRIPARGLDCGMAQ